MSLPLLIGPTGPTGPRGLQGPQGNIGPQGPTGSAEVTHIFLGALPIPIQPIISDQPISLVPLFADGTNYDGTTYLVPEDGIYNLFANVVITPLPDTLPVIPTVIRILIRTLSGTIIAVQDVPFDGSTDVVGLSVSSLYPLDAGDRVFIAFITTNGGQYALGNGTFSGARIADIPPAG